MDVQRGGGRTETLADMAREGNGYLGTSQVTAAGIPRRLLAEAVESGELVQIDRGLYALPETWEDPYLVAQHRFSKGVFSDGTALYLHGMTDRAPIQLTMTFPRSYNKTAAKAAGIVCRSCADGVLGLGLTEVRTLYGNAVRAYDLERTLCDMVRGQRFPDEQVLNPAMRAYMHRRDKNIPKLLGYARELGVEGKIQNFVRVLL